VTTTGYSVQGTNAFGCAASIGVTVTVNPLPVVDAGADQVLCDQPVPVNLAGSPAGGTWSGSPNLTPGGTFTPNGSEEVDVVYTYTDGATGCTQSDTLHISVSPPVIPSFTQGQEICFESAAVNLNTFLNPTPSGGS